MGNDNSRQAENEQEANADDSSGVSRQQQPSNHKLESKESAKSKERGGKVEETFCCLIAEDLSVTSATPSGEVPLPYDWEEGQLLPVVPFNGLHIAGLGDKGPTSSPHVGTISEESREDPNLEEEIGLIGILKEWGKDVLPEKLPVKSNNEYEDSTLFPEVETDEPVSGGDLQFPSTSEASTDSQSTIDIKPEASECLTVNDKEIKIALLRKEISVSETPHHIPESTLLSTREEAPLQPEGLSGNSDNTGVQTKGDSRDCATAQDTQQGLQRFSDSEPLTTDGMNTQTSEVEGLIQPYVADGSSKNKDRDKMPIQEGSFIDRYEGSEETPAIPELPPTVAVPQHMMLPETISHKPITSSAGHQAIEKDSLILGQVAEYIGYQNVIETQAKETDTIDVLSTDKIVSKGMKLRLRDNSDKTESGFTSQEINYDASFIIKSKENSSAFHVKDACYSELDIARGNIDYKVLPEEASLYDVYGPNPEEDSKSFILTTPSPFVLDSASENSGLPHVFTEGVEDKVKDDNLNKVKEKPSNLDKANIYYTDETLRSTEKYEKYEKPMFSIEKEQYNEGSGKEAETEEEGTGANRKQTSPKNDIVAVKSVILNDPLLKGALPFISTSENNPEKGQEMDTGPKDSMEFLECYEESMFEEDITKIQNTDTTEQAESSNNDFGLPVSILCDVDILNLKPHGATQELAIVQPTQNSPLPTTEAEASQSLTEENASTVLGNMTIKNKEGPLTTSSQQGNASLEETPFPASDSLLYSVKLSQDPGLLENLLNSVSDSQLAVGKPPKESGSNLSNLIKRTEYGEKETVRQMEAFSLLSANAIATDMEQVIREIQSTDASKELCTQEITSVETPVSSVIVSFVNSRTDELLPQESIDDAAHKGTANSSEATLCIGQDTYSETESISSFRSSEPELKPPLKSELTHQSLQNISGLQSSVVNTEQLNRSPTSEILLLDDSKTCENTAGAQYCHKIMLSRTDSPATAFTDELVELLFVDTRTSSISETMAGTCNNVLVQSPSGRYIQQSSLDSCPRLLNQHDPCTDVKPINTANEYSSGTPETETKEPPLPVIPEGSSMMEVDQSHEINNIPRFLVAEESQVSKTTPGLSNWTTEPRTLEDNLLKTDCTEVDDLQQDGVNIQSFFKVTKSDVKEDLYFPSSPENHDNENKKLIDGHNIQFVDNAAEVLLHGGNQSFDTVQNDTKEFLICAFPDVAQKHSTMAVKSEETLAAEHSNAHKDIHPAEKNPETVCKENLEFNTEFNKTTGYGFQEFANLQNDTFNTKEDGEISVGRNNILDNKSVAQVPQQMLASPDSLGDKGFISQISDFASVEVEDFPVKQDTETKETEPSNVTCIVSNNMETTGNVDLSVKDMECAPSSRMKQLDNAATDDHPDEGEIQVNTLILDGPLQSNKMKEELTLPVDRSIFTEAVPEL
ncbi:uncharacterized protein LOC121396202 isoform X2 [Xenopus laevis]|uniref:Uncharacterized protein LOC121396202 isoform X2 n=1 Tax=Xenopus laevis TaxID=8355 RepID=A0A8J1LBA9_XENLA|nr:uncharacterized protein LOC121396202 isoform X2 [Xenopus laevis]